MNGTSEAQALRREQARGTEEGGEISRLPLALRLDVNIYYVCLFSPRRWLSAKLAAAGLGPGPARCAWNLPQLTSSASRSVSPRFLEPEQEAGSFSPATEAAAARQPASSGSWRLSESANLPGPASPPAESPFFPSTSLAPSLPTLAWPLSCDVLGLIAGGATEISAPGV